MPKLFTTRVLPSLRAAGAFLLLAMLCSGFATEPDAAGLKSKAERGDAEAQFLLGRYYARGKAFRRILPGRRSCTGRPPAGTRQGTKQSRFALSHGLGRWRRTTLRPSSGFVDPPSRAFRSPGQSRPAARLEQDPARDPQQAVEWFQKAAAQNCVEAQYDLGDLYYRGTTGFEKNYPQAFAWLSKAAGREYPPAQNLLGQLFEDGQGVAKNPAKAAELFRAAAELGDAQAQDNLGRALFHRQGCAAGFFPKPGCG